MFNNVALFGKKQLQFLYKKINKNVNLFFSKKGQKLASQNFQKTFQKPYANFFFSHKNGFFKTFLEK